MAFSKSNLARIPLGKRRGKQRSAWVYYCDETITDVVGANGGASDNYFIAMRSTPIKMEHGDLVTVVNGTLGSETTYMGRVVITGAEINVIQNLDLS